MTQECQDLYKGFELGPIRPPSEADSLMLRITRNCPWNRCTFCHLYKQAQFSLRPVQDIKRDIDQIHTHVTTLRGLADSDGRITRDKLELATSGLDDYSIQTFAMALQWCAGGMQAVFLQDANSMIARPHELIEILEHLRNRFPEIRRVTSYARSHTLTRIKQETLNQIAAAGLNRVHVGFESGCDEVLRFVQKGCTREDHIVGGQRAKQAGMEVSFYFMPGLGGVRWSEPHARESAEVVNQVNPDFLRIRSLRIAEIHGLYQQVLEGNFTILEEADLIRELKRFIGLLDGISTMVASDHLMNTLQDVEGRLPQDKQLMLDRLQAFLDLSDDEQIVYRVGRAMGLFLGVSDFADLSRKSRAEEARRELGVTKSNVTDMLTQLGMVVR